MITHHQAFAHIVEWQTPSFSNAVNVVFLVEVLLAVVLLVARRGTIEDVLVVALFGAAALMASRNVPVAALLVTPVLARGLAGIGTIDGNRRGIVPATGMVALVALGVALTAGAVQRPAYNLSLYPVQEVSWLQSHGLVPGSGGHHRLRGQLPRIPLRHPRRCLHRRPGRRLSPRVSRRTTALCSTGPQGWQTVLARYRFGAVLWPRTEALASLIAEDPGWTVRISDRHWVVAVRNHPPRSTRPEAGPSQGRANFLVNTTFLFDATATDEIGAGSGARELGEKCGLALRIGSRRLDK